MELTNSDDQYSLCKIVKILNSIVEDFSAEAHLASPATSGLK